MSRAVGQTSIEQEEGGRSPLQALLPEGGSKEDCSQGGGDDADAVVLRIPATIHTISIVSVHIWRQYAEGFCAWW